ncbi:hypothetical protein WJX81_008019 [Elliptochloris bilobata]|uniref:Thioredoxin-dependent peroxiredoxin n=1 Tax=Elliptochloris bilobata TaxID=381761 RepID=A0AAW1SB68_9CHLO
MATSAPSPQYSALLSKQVYLQEQPVVVTDLWKEEDAAVIVWPELRQLGIKFFLVSIGPPARAREFCDLTGFPEDHLLADPDNVLYDALGMRKDVASTFFNIATPQSIWQRIQKDGAAGLRRAISSWKPWIPPKQGQATQQGGVVVFDGQRCVLEHKDRATGAHIDLRDLLRAATPLAKTSPAT